jgi:glucokinase-like ROK family protein
MLKARTGDQALVREINLSIILNALREHAPTSRASLAALTGLNKTTVSSLVQQLIDAGFVLEMGTGKIEDTGRPGIFLQLNPAAGCIIGAEIGVDYISVIVTDFAVRVVHRHHETTGPTHEKQAIIERALAAISDAVEAARDHSPNILGLGLGVPGLVDVASGTLLFAPNLKWRDVPLRTILEEQFTFPVFVDNEANMAALGESYFGVARGARTVLYVSAGVGLGGGIVLDSRIMPGAAGFVGEVGHMTMDPAGIPCNCGNNGCWETLVSQSALFRRVRDSVHHGKQTTLTEKTGGDLTLLTVPMIAQAAQEGDTVALKAHEETAISLGMGLANLVNALNPEIVVFGGILSVASHILMPLIEQEISRRALPWSVRAMRVLPAAHGFDACVMGGVATVYHEVLSRPSGAHSRIAPASRNGAAGNMATGILTRQAIYPGPVATPEGGDVRK